MASKSTTSSRLFNIRIINIFFTIVHICLFLNRALSLTEIYGTTPVATENKLLNLQHHDEHPVISKDDDEHVGSETKKGVSSDPMLVFHIGPKKTGTTTIQCSFVGHASLLASSSSYRYLGKTPGFGCGISEQTPDHLDGTGVTDTNESIVPLYDDVASLLKQGHSPIFSSETISTEIRAFYKENIPKPETVRLIERIKEEGGWNTKIILMYRRYFDWVISYYRQRLSITQEFESGKYDCHISMVSFFEKAEAGFKTDYSPDAHPVQLYTEAIENVLGIDVTLVNMYRQLPTDRVDLLAVLVRQGLPDAEEFYQLLEHEEKHPALHADADLTDWLHFAFAAYKEGLVPSSSKFTPKKLARKLKKKSEVIRGFLGGTIPKSCLHEDTLKTLLESSLRFEKEIYPEWSSRGDVEREHREAFNTYRKGGRFCEVDVKKVLENMEVRDLVKRKVITMVRV